MVQRTGDAAQSFRALVEMGERIGVEVVCTKDGRVFDDSLDDYAAIAFFTNNDLTLPNPQQEPPMSAAGKQNLLDSIAGGKGFIGFHSSCGLLAHPAAKDGQSPELDPFWRCSVASSFHTGLSKSRPCASLRPCSPVWRIWG
ncbi:MAG: hypothetical protein R3C56_20980 [Pirellulaceae bacterium]